MGRVTTNIHLIYTVHRPNGLCNQEQLVGVLRNVNPDVIFEELKPSFLYDYHKSGTKWSVESQAVDIFSQEKRFVQVPVDDFEGEVTLYGEVNPMFDYVESTSQQYLALEELRNRRICFEGYSFLNSVDCMALTRRMRDLFEHITLCSGNNGLIQTLQHWNSFNGKREATMIENIHAFCETHEFKTGVFLLGAAHCDIISDTGENIQRNSNVNWICVEG